MTEPSCGVARMSMATPSYVPYPPRPDGAPNVVVIVLDDVGFAQLGCFGSAISTPNIDRLAGGGLRYNRFHVTSICSSTRAALLSGRNHHAVAMGMTMETPMGFPGYTGRIPRSAALLPRILRDNGYSTMAVGKWHLCPRGEYSASGPMQRWPLGQGFERFYGFLSAETSQWDPPLCQDNTFVDPPRSPAQGYHLTEDLAEHAIRMILDQQQATPDKPFFCYLATGAAHAPHQVPPEWIKLYRGSFDDGWEALRASVFDHQIAEGIVPASTVLTPRPPWVQDWTTLTRDERRLFARYMEVFAAFLTHADAQVGRLIDFLAARDILDDTLLLVLSDNGASAEGSRIGTINEPNAWMSQVEGVDIALNHLDELGGHRTFNHYPWGWAWAGNTPLQLWKRYAWLGGVRTPLIIHWPGHTADPGGIRSQFCHAVDLFSTILDAAGIDPPAIVDGINQQRIDGATVLPTLADASAPSPRATQYFEMHGSRGIYHQGWKATTDYVAPLFGEREHLIGSHDFDDDHWALFNLDDDFAETNDLSGREPQRLERMKELWWAEAGRNQVLPLWDGPQAGIPLHPAEYPAPTRAVYQPGGNGICESHIPSMLGGFTATADIELPADHIAQGVLCALGDLNGGWTFYIIDGCPVTCVVSCGHTTRVAAPSALRAGTHTVTMRYRPAHNDVHNVLLDIDGELVASAHHPGLLIFPALATAGARMHIGRDSGLPFSDDYQPPFPFSATLRNVVLQTEHTEALRTPADVIATATAAD